MIINQKVASVNIPNFNEKIKEICKKFKVCYSVEMSDEYSEITKNYDGIEIEDFYYDVTIDIPEYNNFTDTGFSYLGCIKQDEVISVHPTVFASNKEFSLTSLKEEIKTFPCHECGKVVTRKIIHVFENDTTGKISVFGSSCAVKKFGVDFSSIIQKFEYIREGLSRFSESTRDDRTPVRAEEWCKLTWNNIKHYGYVSGKKAETEFIESTKDSVWSDYQSFYNNKAIRDALIAQMAENNFDYKAMLVFLDDHISNMKENDMKFNMENIFSVLKNDYIAIRLSGYVAYMVFLYWASLHIKKESEGIVYNTDYSDINVGDKIKGIKVTFISEHSFSSVFGLTFIYTFKGIETSHKYKWKTTKEIPECDEYIFTGGTVKEFEDHSIYGKSIIITRAKIKENK